MVLVELMVAGGVMGLWLSICIIVSYKYNWELESTIIGSVLLIFLIIAWSDIPIVIGKIMSTGILKVLSAIIILVASVLGVLLAFIVPLVLIVCIVMYVAERLVK